nr:hypothetical protein [Pandoravirus massiliensis]
MYDTHPETKPLCISPKVFLVVLYPASFFLMIWFSCFGLVCVDFFFLSWTPFLCGGVAPRVACCDVPARLGFLRPNFVHHFLLASCLSAVWRGQRKKKDSNECAQTGSCGGGLWLLCRRFRPSLLLLPIAPTKSRWLARLPFFYWIFPGRAFGAGGGSLGKTDATQRVGETRGKR